jgi:peptidoglycan-associated lipoprotein
MRKITGWCQIALALLVLTGCASTKKAMPPAVEKKVAAPVTAADTLTPVKMDSLTEDELKQVRKILSELQDIPFDFDKYTIPIEGRDILKADIALLNRSLESRGKYIHITLEGNSDERGSVEYNLALGQKRADMVRDYLIAAGFKEKSLTTVSYGKERPKVMGHTEEAWAANRRVHLVVE